MEYNWSLKPFLELSPQELYKVIQLRINVFMLEQDCLYPDLDDKDSQCVHIFAFCQEKGQIAAYARIVPPGLSYEAVPAIGRVVVHPEHRQQQLGRILMERAITATHVLHPKTPGIRLSAQAHLERFYNSLGFVKEGEGYQEDGIDHIQMYRV
jgi:ElaA protein